MEIRRAVPQPYEQSVSSSISFEVDIAHTKRQEAIVNIEGWLESDDGKMLAKIGLMPQTKTQSMKWRLEVLCLIQISKKPFTTQH